VGLELIGDRLIQAPHGNGNHDESDGRYGESVKDKLQDGL
jgi:hypothetical protein